MPPDLWADFLAELVSRFGPEHYSLVQNNCNHFTSECAQVMRVTGDW